MAKEKSKLQVMVKRTKSRTITCWIRQDLEDTVQVLKMREPGGFTGWLEQALSKVKVSPEELAALKVFKKK
jgi:hypothetical protein